MSDNHMSLGQINYYNFCDNLPHCIPWKHLPDATKDSWEHAARRVAEHVTEKVLEEIAKEME